MLRRGGAGGASDGEEVERAHWNVMSCVYGLVNMWNMHYSYVQLECCDGLPSAGNTTGGWAWGELQPLCRKMLAYDGGAMSYRYFNW